MPRVRIVPRADTTLVDAYLNPGIRNYLKGFRRGFTDQLDRTRLLFMQSDGGLAPADSFRGSRAVLSGPAGGVVGYAMTAGSDTGGRPVIGFDMGGTSTDVSRYGGEYELVHETETAGVRIQAPQLQIKTVAAGRRGPGCFLETACSRWGPESAGAQPGPVCYRAGGHLSITDANLVLGRIQPDYFPRIFGPARDLPLDVAASRRAMAALTQEINAHNRERGRPDLTVEETALGFIRVANETMVRPIRELSVMRGYDTRDHVLAAFGGAGPQHACALARTLGINRVFIHRFSGVLSAYGLGLADEVVDVRRPRALVFGPESLPVLREKLEELGAEAMGELRSRGFPQERIFSKNHVNMRYQGTDTALMIPEPGDLDYEKAFRAAYRREFGFEPVDREILVDDIRVRAVGRSAGSIRHRLPESKERPQPRQWVSCRFENGPLETALYRLEDLGAGQRVAGPAIIIHDTTTILVEPACRADITPHGDVDIHVGAPGSVAAGLEVDSGAVGDFQPSFHVHCRADGPHAAKDGGFHQHQGAPGFFLRPVRASRRTGGQRPPFARSHGGHERRGQGPDRTAPGNPAAGGRAGVEPPRGGRKPSAGHHRDHPRVLKR